MEITYLTLAEWQTKYHRMKEIADRIQHSRLLRLRAMCKAAGLDPNLLGIHPNNAMVAYNAGKPWREVNYTICKRLNHLLVTGWMWEADRIISKWRARHRIKFNDESGQAGLSVLTALTSVCFFGYALALILYAGLHHVSLYAAFVWSIKAILAIFGL